MLERIAADREHLAERPRGAIVLAPAAVQVHRKADGTVRMRSPQSLGPYSRCVGDWLEHWADTAPDRIVLAERDGPGWRTLSYGKARDSVRSIAGALLARGLGPQTLVRARSARAARMGSGDALDVDDQRGAARRRIVGLLGPLDALRIHAHSAPASHTCTLPHRDSAG